MIIPNLVIGDMLPDDTSIIVSKQTLRYVILWFNLPKVENFLISDIEVKLPSNETDTEIKLFDENDMKIKIKRKFVMAVLVISCCRYII